MEDFFEIIFYIVVMGLAVFFNIKKSKNKTEGEANGISEDLFSQVDDLPVEQHQKPSFKSSTAKMSADIYIPKANVEKKIGSRSTPETPVKREKNVQEKHVQSIVKQRTREVDLRRAIILSEIIRRPYE